MVPKTWEWTLRGVCMMSDCVRIDRLSSKEKQREGQDRNPQCCTHPGGWMPLRAATRGQCADKWPGTDPRPSGLGRGTSQGSAAPSPACLVLPTEALASSSVRITRLGLHCRFLPAATARVTVGKIDALISGQALTTCVTSGG